MVTFGDGERQRLLIGAKLVGDNPQAS